MSSSAATAAASFSPGTEVSRVVSRDFIPNCKRIIVKVGTAVVTQANGRLALGRLGALVEQLEALVRSGKEMILVTSGACGVGRQRLRYTNLLHSSVKDLHEGKLVEIDGKAAAAAGQSGLMALYDMLFSQLDLVPAQMLVTDEDFKDPEFRTQLRATVDQLIGLKVLPVFNENDAISTRKAPYKDASGIFWDNDSLAALLSVELSADLLLLMSDVDGLFTGPPSDPASRLIRTYSPELHDTAITYGAKSRLGRGGMTAKVDAAWMAACKGIPTVICNGKKHDTLARVALGEHLGTLFCTTASKAAAAAESGARHIAQSARSASRALQALPSSERVAILHRMADALLAHEATILTRNAEDVAAAVASGLAPALLDRLRLKPGRLQQLADGMRAIAAMPEPVGRTLLRREIASGLVLEKVTAPLGVLMVIFESRPDALPQIAALALRAGCGLLLKGGKEAAATNGALHAALVSALSPSCPIAVLSMLAGRESVDDLLRLDEAVDLVIPRGSNALVAYVKAHTKIAVLGHGDGVCHVYVDAGADGATAAKIVVDAKVDYPSACNAMETLLLHETLLSDGRASRILDALTAAGVNLRGGPRAASRLGLELQPAMHTEYGTLMCTVEIVESLDAAVAHIHAHGSGHTECIVTEDAPAAADFLRRVDSACVFHNASTRFADGFRFGLGAEVGVSTSRIHARGPVGVDGLLTSRWLLRGTGQVVAKDAGVNYTHKDLPLL